MQITRFFRVFVFLSSLWMYTAMSVTLVRAECKCPQVLDTKAVFEKATVVFVGKVEESSRSLVKEGKQETRFEVMKKIKGFDQIKTKELYVYSGLKDKDCPVKFSENFDYVVYATGPIAGLYTSSCHHTVILEQATAELESLSKVANMPHLKWRDARDQQLEKKPKAPSKGISQLDAFD